MVLLATPMVQAQETPLRTLPAETGTMQRAPETRKERLTLRTQLITDRLNAMVAHFDALGGRLLSYLNRVSQDPTTAPKNTDAAKLKIEEAMTLNTKVKGSLAELNTKMATALSASDLAAAFKTLRPELDTLRTDLRLVHATLLEAIRLIRTN